MSKWEKIATAGLTSVAIWGVMQGVVLLTSAIFSTPLGVAGEVVPLGLASVYFLFESRRIARRGVGTSADSGEETSISRS